MPIAIMRHIFATLLISICTLSATQASENQQDLIKLLSGWQGFSADFTQRIEDADGNLLQESQGEMTLLKPGHLHWQTLQPFPQLLVTDGKTLWLYDPDLEQVTIQPLSKTFTQTPAFILSSDPQRLVEDFDITSLPTSGFDLIPKQPQSTFTHIEIFFDDATLVGLSVFDLLGQKTSVSFQHLSYSDSYPEQQFHFDPPAGTDVFYND